MRMISKPPIDTKTIAAELNSLNGCVECSAPENIVDAWARLMPNISPSQLYSTLVTLPGDPKLTVDFVAGLCDEKPASADITVSGEGYKLKLNALPGMVDFRDMYLDSKNRNRSLAKELLRWTQKLALQMKPAETEKPARIAIQAGLSNGAYTWARFGFTPRMDMQPNEWQELKNQMTRFRLNQDCSSIVFDPEALERSDHDYSSQYMHKFPQGFSLTTDEQKIIQTALKSDNPRDLWLLSDLGRELGQTGTPPHEVTVGKALLCGLAWAGELLLDEKDPGYQRFKSYTNLVPERAQKPQGAAR